MKKVLLIINCILSLSALSGCEVHFGEARYDVPWWLAFILFALPFLIFGAVLIISDMPKNFWAYCTKCQNRFYMKKRVLFRFDSHSRDSFEFITKCPCCKERTMCRKSYDQD